MAEGTEIRLGNGQHTIFSDEVWYLVVPPGSTHPFVEARFQSDAPDRTGYPSWALTEFCVKCEGGIALCQFPLRRLPQPGEPNRFATVPDGIWNRAVEECGKLMPTPRGDP
jgi:hypothetical protein